MKHLKLLAALLLASAVSAMAQPRVEDGFVRPPEEARPWVYWFWSDGNVTRPGITADLEAMKRVGVGGVIWMEVDQAVPKGPARFMSPQWRELMAFAVSEAARLGLKIDLNNDAGWNGSGGPWIDAEHSMQKVVWTETRVKGPVHFEAELAQPETAEGFYRDIALLAFPTPSVDQRLDKFAPKSGMGLGTSPEQPAAMPAAATVARSRIVDVTAQLHQGRLSWDVPEGDWTLMRVGHTSTARVNHPSPEEGRGLEADKLDGAALDRHYDGFVGKVIADAGPAGKAALSAVHIDSWEIGYQNWTGAFREVFRQRRGYDLLPFLPAFAGRVVDSTDVTERFLWDVRRTISELVNDNYAQRTAERAHADGRVFTLEAYSNGPFDCLSYGGRADVPVAEFWMAKDPTKMHTSVKTMTSVGHIYGRSVIAAEAFTATDALGRQRNHPYSMKAIGDAAFCAGVNHFVVHRYSMQPWVDDRKPGMTMGPWGVEYERTATWWEQTKPWHEYVARCQYLLRQGRFVGDFCYLQSEEGINNPASLTTLLPAVPEGFDFDFCSDEVVRTRMQVQNGRLVLPDGMSYRVLVLPQQRLMTPTLLRKIRDLVRDGAVVFGRPPLHSPSLSGYPASDAEVKQLVAELWGDAAAGDAPVDRVVGKGRVLWAPTLDAVLPKLQFAPDFAFRMSTAGRPAAAAAAPADVPAIRYIHRTLADREVYFVANLSASPASLVASFRASGAPELWNAEDGTMTPAPVFDAADGRVRVALTLEPRGSRFVVFRSNAAAAAHVIRVTKDGATLCEASPVPIDRAARPAQRFEPVINSFTMAAWVKPAGDTALPKEAATGTGAYTVARNDVLYPPPVHEVLGPLDLAGAGFAVGRNGITVLEHGDHLFAATLVAPMPVTDWTFVAVVFNGGVPTLYVNGERVKTGLKTAATVYGGVGVPHGRDVEPFRGEYSAVRQIGRALTAAEVRQWMLSTPKTPVPPRTAPSESFVAVPLPALQLTDRAAWIGAAGSYEVQLANGQKRTIKPAAVPSPIRVDGPWTVRFPANWGAPAEIQLPVLGSLSEQSDPGVRYFSGTATYSKSFDVPSTQVGPNYRTWLELGEVQVIAEVTLNGRPLATLWKPPYRVDLTPALKAGRNELEVRVTNLWVNRLIGDEQLPLDREWTKVPRRGGFALKSYPDWFLRGERSPTGRVTFTTWKHYEKDAPLMRSGLIGPVTLQTQVKVPIE